jgi:hypothetical protein
MVSFLCSGAPLGLSLKNSYLSSYASHLSFALPPDLAMAKTQS